jgi:hypothetical protein
MILWTCVPRRHEFYVLLQLGMINMTVGVREVRGEKTALG